MSTTLSTWALLLALEPSNAEPPRASLAVDTSDVGSSGPIIAARIRETGGQRLRDGGVLPAKTEADPTVLVIVHEYLEGDPGYRFEVVVKREGDTLRSEQAECRLCTETELLDEIGARIEREAVLLAAVEARLPDEPDPAPAQRLETPTPVASMSDGSSDQGPALGVRGKVGIGLLSAGTAGLAVGIGLAVAPPRDDSGDPTRNIYTDVPGYVTIGISLGVAAVGGVLLALDLRDAKRRRSVALTPLLGPVSGAALSGRF